MSVKTPAKGHTSKHTRHAKHGSTKKHKPVHHKTPATAHSGHHVTTVGKHPSHGKARGYAIGDLLPVCSFEAVAQSLRVLGQRVPDDDVLALWDLCGQREVSIAEALEGADHFGLAGCRPLSVHALDERSLPFGQRLHVEDVDLREVDDGLGDGLLHGLILGVDLPGPHAVLATPDGWWSWGELYSPWPCRIEEAWAVRWA